MYKKIPFYGKIGTIKNIKELGENYFEVATYSKDGSVLINNINIEKEEMLKKYLNDISGYLEIHKQNYKDIKHVVDNDLVTKSCKKILAVSLGGLVLIPLMCLTINVECFLGILALCTILTMAPISYSITEITKKVSINDMKKSIEEYDGLIKESERIKKGLEIMKTKETTKYSLIEPKKVEVEVKDKKLVKKDK